MDHDRFVSKERIDALSGRGVKVGVGSSEWIRSDLAIFASEITNLAGLGKTGVAGNGVTTLERVEMGESAQAVTAGVDGGSVNVVNFGC